MKLPLVILALWFIALSLGIIGIVTRRRALLAWGMGAALGGVLLTYWLKSMLN